MKLLLLKIARVPLLLAAMLVGFAEIARGPAGVGADVYRDGDRVALGALEAQRAIDARGLEAQRALEAQRMGELAPVAPVLVTDVRVASNVRVAEAAPSGSWSDRLRELAAGEGHLTVLSRRDDDRQEMRLLASAGVARSSLTP